MSTEITVPATGPVVLPGGRVLNTRSLGEFAHDADADLGPELVSERRVRRAIADGQVICVRPSARPAQFGMTRDEAMNEVYHDASRIVAVDPYTMDGAPIRFGQGTLVRFTPQELAKRAH